jgi:uncharacterized protein YwgA
MNRSKLNGADYLLTLFYLPDGKSTPIEGKTRITKMMFLFNKEIYPKLDVTDITSEDLLPKFVAYNYGPFSKDVHEQLYIFCNIGFLSIKERELNIVDSEELDVTDDLEGIEDVNDKLVGGNPTVEQFVLTDRGKNFVKEKILSLLTSTQIEILTKFKERIITMPLKDILSYVYRKYPDFIENSLIKEQVLGNGR